MKKVVSLIIAIILSWTLFAQQSPADKFFQKHSGVNGYTCIYLSESMFSLISLMKPDDPEFNLLLKGLSGMRLLIQETKIPTDSFYSELRSELMKSDYQELLAIFEGVEQVSIFAKNDNGSIKEFLIFSKGSNQMILSIQGSDINIQQLAKIAQILNIKELELVDRLF